MPGKKTLQLCNSNRREKPFAVKKVNEMKDEKENEEAFRPSPCFFQHRLHADAKEMKSGMNADEGGKVVGGIPQQMKVLLPLRHAAVSSYKVEIIHSGERPVAALFRNYLSAGFIQSELPRSAAVNSVNSLRPAAEREAFGFIFETDVNELLSSCIARIFVRVND